MFPGQYGWQIETANRDEKTGVLLREGGDVDLVSAVSDSVKIKIPALSRQ